MPSLLTFQNPLIIQPRESYTLDVQFAPRQAGLRRGAIELFTSNPQRPVTTVPLVGTGLNEAPGNVRLGNDYVAIRAASSRVQLARTDDSGQFPLNLPPGTRYSYTAFDPETGLVSQQYEVVPVAGQYIQRLDRGFVASNKPDRDGDGLPDDVELAVGSDPLNPDTNQDGIDDFLSLYQAISPTEKNLGTVMVYPQDLPSMGEPLQAEELLAAEFRGAVAMATMVGQADASTDVETGVAGSSTTVHAVEATEDRIEAGPLQNGEFTTDDPAAAEFGWVRRGSVMVADGVATLSEDLRYLSGLSQVFVIPEDARQLRFEIRDLEFATTGMGSPPDAFEVALLDASTQLPVTGAVEDLSDSDALLNFQATGEVYFAPSVTVPGVNGSGDLATLQWPLEITISLGDVDRSRPVVLHFDLLGLGNVGSQAVIDNVHFVLVEPDIIVTPTGGLTTSEDGTTAQFTVELTALPTANVTVHLFSTNLSEGTIEPSIVTFTPDDWDTPIPVTVTGVDDDAVDGDVPFVVVTGWATSLDRRYHGINPSDVRVTNLDNDTLASVPASDVDLRIGAVCQLLLDPIVDPPFEVHDQPTLQGSRYRDLAYALRCQEVLEGLSNEVSNLIDGSWIPTQQRSGRRGAVAPRPADLTMEWITRWTHRALGPETDTTQVPDDFSRLESILDDLILDADVREGRSSMEGAGKTDAAIMNSPRKPVAYLP